MNTAKKLRALDLPCPRCEARPGRPCNGSRIPGPGTLGGGWGGPSPLDRPHSERQAVRRALEALRAAVGDADGWNDHAAHERALEAGASEADAQAAIRAGYCDARAVVHAAEGTVG